MIGQGVLVSPNSFGLGRICHKAGALFVRVSGGTRDEP